MKKTFIFLYLCLFLISCVPVNSGTGYYLPSSTVNGTLKQTSNPSRQPTISSKSPTEVVATVTSTPTPTLRATTQVTIPNFDHVALIVLENHDYNDVIGNPSMPNLNTLAEQNVLLSNYFAVSHPSLPNYIALMSGSTQNITSDCKDCFVDQTNLADLIDANGLSWKSYLEDMPSPCFLGDADPYVQKHNPLIYFDSIRLDTARCEHGIVPLTELDTDLAANKLPNFLYIMPNMCNSAHDCKLDSADEWIKNMVDKLLSSPAFGNNSLIIITFDEGDKKDTGSCCGLGDKAGGQVATVLISPNARQSFDDNTPYSHYSILKLILKAWNLPEIGLTTSAPLIEAPWELQLSSTIEKSSIPSTVTPDPISIVPTPIPSKAVEGIGHELAFPIRAAFYYPWFPHSWNQSGINPFTNYQPTLGFYSSDNIEIIQQHITAMKYGKIQAGIASWWGQDQYSDHQIPALLKEGEKTGFYWTLYVESEGQGNPSVEAIQSDLTYIRDHYATSPAYLRINGRFVIFVYADSSDKCEMADRWNKANNVGAYLVLKVISWL